MTGHADIITVDNAAVAQRDLADRKRQLPPVASIYVPSGVCPPNAVPRIVAAVALGSLAAVGAGGLALFAAWFSIFWLYEYWASHASSVNIFVLLVSLLFGGGFVLLAMTVVGNVAGKAVARAGKSAKNRSPRWAAVAAVVSAVLAIGALVALLSQPSVQAQSAILQTFDPFGLKNLRGALPLLGIFGAIVAGTVATTEVVAAVQEQRFCERCDTNMTSALAARISWDGAAAIRNASPSDILDTLKRVAAMNPGTNASVVLAYCPSCGSGYADSHACFLVRWVAPQPGQLHEDWRFDSRRVPDVRTILTAAPQPAN